VHLTNNLAAPAKADFILKSVRIHRGGLRARWRRR